MTESLALSASLEDYLEAIYHCEAQKHAARVKDISARLHVNYPSVTGALRSLAEKGLVNYAPYDLITLTPKGMQIAQDVIRRHEALRDFFVKVLAVDHTQAEEAACKLEHAVSPDIVERFIQFVEFVEICPRGGAKWIKGFGYQCKGKPSQHACERCLAVCMSDLKARNLEGGSATVTATLKELKPGQKGRILKIRGRGEASKRMADMGVTHGAMVEVERVAPLGDPIEIKLKGYHLSLRKDDAEGISVEVLQA